MSTVSDHEPVGALRAYAARIRIRRTALGKTQDEIALATGLSRTQVTNVEAGRTWLSIPAHIALCAALEVDPGPLLSVPTCKRCGDLPPPGFRCLACGSPRRSEVVP